MADRRVTPADAEKILGVPANTISQWKKRDLVETVGAIRGPSRTGLVPVFRLSDLERLAAKYHARKTRRTA